MTFCDLNRILLVCLNFWDVKNIHQNVKLVLKKHNTDTVSHMLTMKSAFLFRNVWTYKTGVKKGLKDKFVQGVVLLDFGDFSVSN